MLQSILMELSAQPVLRSGDEGLSCGAAGFASRCRARIPAGAEALRLIFGIYELL